MSFGLQRMNSLICSSDFFNIYICTPFSRNVGVTSHFWLVISFAFFLIFLFIILNIFVRSRLVFVSCLAAISILPLLFVSFDIIIKRNNVSGKLKAVDYYYRNYEDFQVRKLLELQLGRDAKELCDQTDRSCLEAVASVRAHASNNLIDDVNELKKANYDEAIKVLTDIGRLAPLLAAIFIPVIGYVAKLIAEEAPIRIHALSSSGWTERVTYLCAVAFCSMAAASLIASLGYAVDLLNIKMAGMIGGDMITARTVIKPYFSQYESLMLALMLTAIGFIFIILIRRNDPKEPQKFDVCLQAPPDGTVMAQTVPLRFEVVIQAEQVTKN